MEDAVAMYWQNKNQKYNRTVIKASAEEYIVVNDAAPFLQASPDRTFWLDENRTPDNKGILECKTTLMQVDPNDPPLQWVYQVMWLMGATGMKTSSLAWIGYNFEFGFVNIDFDQQLFNVMLEMASDFWCKLERGIEPAPINANDIVKLYPKEIEGNSVEASAELCEAVERIKQLKVQLKDIDTEISELEDSVKVGMEGAEKLVSTGLTLATWKAAKDSTKFDSKRYQSDHPDECKDYIVTVPGSRRFLIK
jgi:predicted phage-related endonuclease